MNAFVKPLSSSIPPIPASITQPLLSSGQHPQETFLTLPAATPPHHLVESTLPHPNVQDLSSFKPSITSLIKLVLKTYLSSRKQQYITVTLVLLDLLRSVAGVAVNINLNQDIHDVYEPPPILNAVRSAIGILGLIFSNIFSFELLTSVWAFGWRYFLVPAHVVDALVIFTNAIASLLPNGPLQQAASLTMILRLWRLFKNYGPMFLDSASIPLLREIEEETTGRFHIPSTDCLLPKNKNTGLDIENLPHRLE
ncbi:BgTH12-00651 [Blumeria graminis f. sp. triticale]|uniref:BgTH12-00651 n=1 Tax=Blumeria graminis f. sp. triticale TaxID=1689686 RepID=A0A9W4D6U4_BLUGR|nr:BgTH12-00651 [Blumeria graminis f. sp. triticale]